MVHSTLFCHSVKDLQGPISTNEGFTSCLCKQSFRSWFADYTVVNIYDNNTTTSGVCHSSGHDRKKHDVGVAFLVCPKLLWKSFAELYQQTPRKCFCDLVNMVKDDKKYVVTPTSCFFQCSFFGTENTHLTKRQLHTKKYDLSKRIIDLCCVSCSK